MPSPSHTAQQILESGLARYGWGGSKGGTAAATDKTTVETRRLYASVDEMIFDKSRANSIVTPSEGSSDAFADGQQPRSRGELIYGDRCRRGPPRHTASSACSADCAACMV